ncbi:putative HD superfamily hydrolase of NAD metabolism [Granulicatella balaenopterae]|uniref:bis(5'-nucleosyl)-tetraphosphatase (symmetrical) n=1 Tax=Granulicatella balaenopterae TaxID=137733 RepID=A0A1H9IDI5_9LACT|nr:bis(5'-nucleosyl)-tetraphosphatase (symmetrical) YqeK [Granulicatella balaenopterae]SEQ72646.1 putative HD superfamily hydrolase of NAD metabolism [Granulicatella balaenopterae]
MINDFTPYCLLAREELLAKISANMRKSRFEHTLRVEQKAIQLAKKYGVSETKAALAALVHDYAKDIPVEELQRLAVLYRLPASYHQQNSNILHGPVASKLLDEEFGITDQEIQLAVYQHTIGGKEMSTLSQIIFMADATEDGRDYPGVEEARRIVNQDLFEGVCFMMKHTLHYLIDIEADIFIEAIEVYNELVAHKADK